MIINQLIDKFANINKDVPLMNINGTSLYLDDILLIILTILLLGEDSCDITIPIIFLLLIFS